MYYSSFLFFKQNNLLATLATLSIFLWKIQIISSNKKKAPLQRNKKIANISSFSEVTFSYRVDVFFRLLLPATLFITVFKSYRSVFLNSYTYLIVAPNTLDMFNLLLFSNPIFINTQLFDISAFINNLNSRCFKVLYYIYKLPTFSTWLVLFLPYENLTNSIGAPSKVISVEKLFKAASWAEREVGELFGIFFTSKITNRKLITDYFFKVYPLLKWVPSVGFTEVYCSAEGFFANRTVKLFNSALS